MTRRTILFVSMIMAACSPAARPPEQVIPAQAGSWTRAQVSPLAASEAPEIIRQLGLKRAFSATYTGPSTVAVRVYEMNVATSAFELIQKWRQQDGLAVYNGPFFIVAGADAGPGAPGLLEELRKRIG